MKKIATIIFLCGSFLLAASAQEAEREFAFGNYRKYYGEARQFSDPEKQEAILKLRAMFRENPQNLTLDDNLEENAGFYLSKLLEDGTFINMNAQERQLKKNDIYRQYYSDTQKDQVGIFIGTAFKRIFQITSAYRLGLIEGRVPDKVLKAILHYGNIELGRSNDMPRFHASCFIIPTGAVNVYFSMLEEMDRAERGEGSQLLSDACDMLKAVALQAWTQPLRRDGTDNDVVSVERFRKHVWWVGGNALAYRQLLPIAAMYSSAPMIDVLSQVCRECISVTSQVTYDDSFWTEGFTADGAGWGHGRQCLIWGYPIHGTSAALRILGMLKGTPWAQSLGEENTAALMNFLRGASWYWYKGYRLVGLDRNSYVWNPDEQDIPYRDMLDGIIEDWLQSFPEQEQKELLQLRKEAAMRRIDMADTEPGLYHGIRWFYNNDDLVRKTPDHLIDVNMASVRCDGLECIELADPYNFYCNDGATLLMRTGNEYFKIMGGWDVTAYPGTTSREGMDRLERVTNWCGFCSRHNFAGAAIDRNRNGAAGFIFEKLDALTKYKEKKQPPVGQNSVLYGFKAYKSWFFIDDFMVALGAGITNMTPEEPGIIRTTIDQTSLENEILARCGKKSVVLDSGTVRFSDLAGKLSGKTELRAGRPVWISQKGKFSYTLLPEYSRDGFVSLETRPADWVKMNCENRNVKGEMPAEVDILRIWVEHGQHPSDDTYGYAVWTGKGELPEKLPFKVVRNDKSVQAVSSGNGRLLQAVFYPFEGSSDVLKADGTELSVSDPCVLMLDRKAGTLYVTDAAMNPSLKEIVVRIDGKEYAVPMPQGELCGSPACISMKPDGRR